MSVFDLFPVLLVTSLFIKLPYAYSYSNPYPSYKDCAPSVCNNFTIKHPFQKSLQNGSPYCGQSGFIDCPKNHSALFTNKIDDYSWFRVLGNIRNLSNTTQSIRIAHYALFRDCSEQLFDTSAFQYFSSQYGFFYLSDEYKMGTVLNCSKEALIPSGLQQIQCLNCGGKSKNPCFFSSGRLSIHRCTSYSIAIPADGNFSINATERNLRQFLQKGFEIRWNVTHACRSCEASGGICYGSTIVYPDFSVCICPDGSHSSNCSDGKPLQIEHNTTVQIEHNTRRFTPAIYGTSSAILAAAVAAAAIILIIYLRKRREQRDEEVQDVRAYMDPNDSRPPSVENFLHGGTPTRYSYAHLKRYTNNFAEKLGQGGFGTVYKGKLPSETLVAVKILNKSRQSRKQFMNEVATVGRIHHLHLVRLLGYCFQGSKRALVYEYMVNGSLEKYIHGDNQTLLDWKQLYTIAMGIARGIAYLHDECRSRILHCDIKPHNVLLDANFSAKISDFGLAKLTDREETHVSLTGARGTPGYVAPEVWSKNYGPVSDKSDVYSYGMLVMEMVGGRKNLDIHAARSSRFYYPEWAFKQVEKGEFSRLRETNIADEEDENMAKKLSVLGLWCIQYLPSQRPSMSKVIQMLEGTVEMKIPPHPVESSTSAEETSIQTTAATAATS
ncbi:hypothetical protein KI387_025968, partial [Taxus chinensis]